MKYNELITTNNMVTAATGATAIYLVSKALLAIFRSPPYSPDSMNLASLSSESFYTVSVKASVPGELRRLLMSLSPNLDDDTKRMTLRNITQCIYLKESEANGCTNDDIKLVASFLDDKDKETKTETLNALKAFTAIWKFKIKIQEYVPKIIETVTSNWDNNLQIAGLKLLNGLHIPDHTHTLLRTQLTNFMDILLTANTSTKVQVLKFLGTLIEKKDFLYDIMNCQAPADFLNLFQTSQPGNLLYEMLVLLERLSEGRQSPQYQSMQWDYNKNSLHEIIFGDNSRLSERLLALIVHPEEGVQTQACKVILSLKINKEESRISSGHTLGSEPSAYPLESTRQSQIANASLVDQPLIPTTESSSDAPHIESGGSFQPLVGTDETSGGSFHPLLGTSETGHSFSPLERANHSFHPLPNVSVEGSDHVLEEPMGSFHSPPVAESEESDNSI
ncbi:armadillo repeat-containing protein 12 [Protobothrops mucrosquamatus]|uniref:armadillo repeat-containing protein 12 n=1 Tax=Protobothrops mucrosquamatus TaxID=103944 RepID=UPI0010FB3907|nr:armadillo repeat-containing protein 12 [Protobothrops mucrosquamatus]